MVESGSVVKLVTLVDGESLPEVPSNAHYTFEEAGARDEGTYLKLHVKNAIGEEDVYIDTSDLGVYFMPKDYSSDTDKVGKVSLYYVDEVDGVKITPILKGRVEKVGTAQLDKIDQDNLDAETSTKFDKAEAAAEGVEEIQNDLDNLEALHADAESNVNIGIINFGTANAFDESSYDPYNPDNKVAEINNFGDFGEESDNVFGNDGIHLNELNNNIYRDVAKSFDSNEKAYEYYVYTKNEDAYQDGRNKFLVAGIDTLVAEGETINNYDYESVLFQASIFSVSLIGFETLEDAKKFYSKLHTEVAINTVDVLVSDTVATSGGNIGQHYFGAMYDAPTSTEEEHIYKIPMNIPSSLLITPSSFDKTVFVLSDGGEYNNYYFVNITRDESLPSEYKLCGLVAFTEEEKATNESLLNTMKAKGYAMIGYPTKAEAEAFLKYVYNISSDYTVTSTIYTSENVSNSVFKASSINNSYPSQYVVYVQDADSIPATLKLIEASKLGNTNEEIFANATDVQLVGFDTEEEAKAFLEYVNSKKRTKKTVNEEIIEAKNEIPDADAEHDGLMTPAQKALMDAFDVSSDEVTLGQAGGRYEDIKGTKVTVVLQNDEDDNTTIFTPLGEDWVDNLFAKKYPVIDANNFPPTNSSDEYMEFKPSDGTQPNSVWVGIPAAITDLPNIDWGDSFIKVPKPIPPQTNLPLPENTTPTKIVQDDLDNSLVLAVYDKASSDFIRSFDSTTSSFDKWNMLYGTNATRFVNRYNVSLYLYDKGEDDYYFIIQDNVTFFGYESYPAGPEQEVYLYYTKKTYSEIVDMLQDGRYMEIGGRRFVEDNPPEDGNEDNVTTLFDEYSKQGFDINNYMVINNVSSVWNNENHQYTYGTKNVNINKQLLSENPIFFREEYYGIDAEADVYSAYTPFSSYQINIFIQHPNWEEEDASVTGIPNDQHDYYRTMIEGFKEIYLLPKNLLPAYDGNLIRYYGSEFENSSANDEDYIALLMPPQNYMPTNSALVDPYRSSSEPMSIKSFETVMDNYKDMLKNNSQGTLGQFKQNKDGSYSYNYKRIWLMPKPNVTLEYPAIFTLEMFESGDYNSYDWDVIENVREDNEAEPIQDGISIRNLSYGSTNYDYSLSDTPDNSIKRACYILDLNDEKRWEDSTITAGQLYDLDKSGTYIGEDAYAQAHPNWSTDNLYIVWPLQPYKVLNDNINKEYILNNLSTVSKLSGATFYNLYYHTNGYYSEYSTDEKQQMFSVVNGLFVLPKNYEDPRWWVKTNN